MSDRSYLQPTRDLKWCPGCGHWRLLKALDGAFRRLDVPENEVVIVTDIGCIGLADRFFTTNAFHGLHGRSVTYATGLKLARPELTVVVLMGDGGCGIGGTHIVNAARRNIGITVVVGNNLNYGMTGCQQSVTTPEGGRTETSPLGSIESPLDVCGLARAGRGGWTGRIASTRDNAKEMEDMLFEALSYDGFSLLDVWEACTGAYLKRNDLPESGLEEAMQKSGLTRTSEVLDRPEYSLEYRHRIINEVMGQPLSRTDLTPSFTSGLERRSGIVIGGSAGQAIESAATIFGAGAILAGLCATQRNIYPITRQSGHSLSETIISPDRIEYTGIEVPDHLIVLSGEGLGVVKGMMTAMGSSGLIIVGEELGNELGRMKARVHRIPESGELGLGKQSAVMVALTLLLHRSGMYPVEALKEACRRVGSARYVEVNLAACESSLECVCNTG